MAKLSLSINSGSDSANSGINTGASSTKLSISKKVVDEGADSAADTASATRISQQVAPGAAQIPDQVSDNPAASITEEDLEQVTGGISRAIPIAGLEEKPTIAKRIARKLVAELEKSDFDV
ncbi:MAG: hypothetical protein MJZ61_08995, partial [Bacteroidales bacterium]|nr:hypothetical protein [Bacteroidales bacterium]